MRSLPRCRSLLLALLAALATAAAGCGTLENEVHITYRSPAETVTMMTLRGGGPMEDILLNGDLRDVLSRAGWEIGSDDGGDGPATLTASYESSDGNPFPDTGTGRGRPANPGQALFRTIETTAEESLFTRRLTVRFTTEPGMIGAPALSDPQGQQVLDTLLAAVGLGPQGSNASPQQLPEGMPNLDRASFDLMLDAVLKLRVAVTVPGRVVLTNGTLSGSDTATWRLDAASLREAREYYVVSEETLWAKAGAAAGAALMFVAAFALLGAYLIAQRRRPRLAPITVPPPDAPGEADDSYINQFRPPASPDETTRLEVPDTPPTTRTSERPPTTP